MAWSAVQLAFNILWFLKPRDIFTVASVCRAWRGLTYKDSMWQKFCSVVSKEQILEDPRNPLSGRDFEIVKEDVQRKRGDAEPVTNREAYLYWNQLKEIWRLPDRPKIKKVAAHSEHVITCMVMTKDYDILTASNDCLLKLWKFGEAEPIRTFIGHTGGVWSCAVSDDTMVSASTDHDVKVWELSTGREIYTLTGHTQTVRCVSLVDGYIVSGSRDNKVRVWNAETGESLHVFQGHTQAVRCLEFNGRYVVSGSYDHQVRMWDILDNPESTCWRVMTGHANRVYSLQYNGTWVVSGSLDCTIRVWDADTGECVNTLRGHESLTGHMMLKQDILVSGNADHTVRVWNVRTGREMYPTLDQHTSAVTAVTFDSMHIISCSDDGSVKLWDLKTGAFIQDLVDITK